MVGGELSYPASRDRDMNYMRVYVCVLCMCACVRVFVFDVCVALWRADQGGVVSQKSKRYHTFREGRYPLPNDESEQYRGDLNSYLFRDVMDGATYLSPLPEEGPEKVLELGTGTGSWAIDMAERFPDCEIVGVDLSRIQPSFMTNVAEDGDGEEESAKAPAGGLSEQNEEDDEDRVDARNAASRLATSTF